jgi:hypothetical protein
MPISICLIRLMRYSTGQKEFRPMRLDFAGTRTFQDKLLPDGTQLVRLAVSGAFGVNAGRDPHFFAGMWIGAVD